MTDELLGGHGQIVADLQHRLDVLCGGDTEIARVVVLRGASGCGKTRIVRELFEQLREAGGEPPYWPALAGVDRITAADTDPMAARKETCPRPDTFVWPAGALPTFGWWGFNCERLSNNIGLDVVSAARPQLDVHLTPLLMAWRDEAGLLDKAKAQRSKIIATVRDATLDEGSGAVLDLLETLNIAVPFAGTLLNWGWKGARAVHRRAQELEAMRVDTDLGRETQTKKRSAGEDLADIIRSVSHPHLPAVVVIEDMHLMGAELAALVDRLSEPEAGSPVLVIGTAWPEGFDNPPYADWITRAKTRGAVQVVDVPPLDDSDLITILRWYAPATTSESATRVVQQLNNPHFLKLWLTLDATRRHINRHDAALVLDADDALRLPHDIEHVLLQRWKELPDLTRTSLLYAVAANPLDDPLAPFIPELIADIAAAFDAATDGTKVLGGLGSAVDLAAWCRVEDRVESFADRLLSETVHRQVPDSFGDEDIEGLRQIARQRLEAWIDAWIDAIGNGIVLGLDAVALILAEWFLASAPLDDEATAEPSRAQAAAQWTLALGAARRYDYTTAIDLGRQAARVCEGQFGVDHPETLDIRATVAHWLGEAGKVDEADTTFRALLPDMQRVLGPDHPRTLATRNNLARWLGEAGKVDAAITAFRDLLTDELRVLGPDHPDTFAARSNFAHWLGEGGKVDAAITAYRDLLTDELRVLGPDHPQTLTTRNNLALLLGSSGKADDAIDAYRDLLTDQLRVLGPDHPITLTTRNNLAFLLTEAGKVDEAITAFHTLVADRQRVLGPDHPDTLKSRNNIARWLGVAGKVEEAIIAYRDLLTDLQRVLGPDHPQTLTTRDNLAAALLAESGNVDDAIAAYRDLLPDMHRALGPDHPDTLTTRNTLAFLLGEAGKVDEAITAYRDLLIDQLRVLGPDHPDTLTMRNNLAFKLGEADRLDEAITAYHALLPDLQRVLGSDHPDTLTTHDNLAFMLGEAGKVDEAIAAYRELLTDQLRVLGPDHADTLTTRSRIAFLLRKAGKVDDAIATYRDLLTDLQRVVGSDHSQTLTTRNRIAFLLGEADRLDEAITANQDLLTDLQRVLGSDHPDTLTTRSNIAFLLGEAGKVDEAIAAYRELLTDQLRVLGPDHVDTLKSRHNIAFLLAEAGKSDDAIAASRDLLPDQMRVLGPDHPATVSTRNYLAYCLGEGD